MSWNLANVNDAAFTKMVDDVANEPDLAKRNALIKQAVYHGTSQFWVVRLPIYVEYAAWYPWLTNYQGENGLGVYNPGGVWARISLDQEMKNEMTGREYFSIPFNGLDRGCDLITASIQKSKKQYYD
jgi:peptide/nickel transport system substrate-binding protein